jgi:hypothetical protein
MHEEMKPVGVIQMRTDNCASLNPLLGLFPLKFRLAEIGCYAGESTAHFAKSDRCQQVIAIDPWQQYDEPDTKMVHVRMEEVEKLFDQRVMGLRVKKMKCKSLEAVNFFQNRELDAVYIDGSHTYEDVVQDINAWLPKVSVYVCGHDYSNVFPGVVRAVNEIFGKPDIVSDSSWLKRI